MEKPQRARYQEPGSLIKLTILLTEHISQSKKGINDMTVYKGFECQYQIFAAKARIEIQLQNHIYIDSKYQTAHFVKTAN